MARIKVVSRKRLKKMDLSKFTSLISIQSKKAKPLRRDFEGERIDLFIRDSGRGSKGEWERIYRFTRAAGNSGRLLCQCVHGVNRSSAAAIISLLHESGNPRSAAKKLYQINPKAHIRKRIIGMIEDLFHLDRNELRRHLKRYQIEKN